MTLYGLLPKEDTHEVFGEGWSIDAFVRGSDADARIKLDRYRSAITWLNNTRWRTGEADGWSMIQFLAKIQEIDETK